MIWCPVGVHSTSRLDPNHPRELARTPQRRSPYATRRIREFPAWGPASLESDDPQTRRAATRLLGKRVWRNPSTTVRSSTSSRVGVREEKRTENDDWSPQHGTEMDDRWSSKSHFLSSTGCTKEKRADGISYLPSTRLAFFGFSDTSPCLHAMTYNL